MLVHNEIHPGGSQTDELSVEASDILRDAVTLSKTGRYLRLATLVEELRRRWPGKGSSIEEAIAFWSRHPPSLDD